MDRGRDGVEEAELCLARPQVVLLGLALVVPLVEVDPEVALVDPEVALV